MQKQQPQHTINFYKKDAEYGYFSNFYKSPFKQGDFFYQTNQHYFQSKKFEGQEYEKQVASAKTPLDSFDLGRSRQHPLRKDWEQVKQQVMLQGLRLKFTQNPNLKAKLMQTGNRKIVQHTEKDKYWGDGKDGSGKNRLGILLMQLRDQFQKQQKLNNVEKQVI